MKRLFNIEDALSLKMFTSDRMSVHLSPDKRWLAYSVYCRFHQGGDSGNTQRQTGVTPEMAASEIWLTDVESGESRNLTPGWGGSWEPRWPPSGEQLVATDPAAIHIVIWDGAGFHQKADKHELPEQIRLPIACLLS